MNGSLRDQLRKWKKQQPKGESIIQKKKDTKVEKKQEQLSQRDLRELMGTNGPRYVRKRGGAYTQR